ncbi:hypothetical protein A2773_04005 [Candidatus Gottesmanbacteria bacterium RIFCSPHIGHO2_01_FULL_39_10]|uniref:DUF2207 domain-containing protein n=1 Tax=Candidatus Gottesmanbacteria bacterium RIFCSPHIGHO2_01_FULL_39_10 TaxID=1798375 RepID=A0A1F5ZQI0_9BACT|nr:MAG: hypothetical protein A2773_04005 [Candidatus Gottesmanbacteria bacterium RIFCSPHIGHO2_01_FULL_39_10]
MLLKKLCFSFFLIFLFLKLPQPVLAEKIDNYSAEITINKDGTINVSEKIDYDFEDLERHGIFRTIPSIKTNQQGKKFRLEIDNISIKDSDGNSYNFTKSYEGDKDDLQLKIGDPDKTITGLHTYIIDYQVSGAITYFSDHDELYWNITGNDWGVPLYQTSVAIKLPENLPEVDVQMDCFTGVVGSTEKLCQSTYADGKVTITTSNILNAGEGLTAVVGFPKNIVAVLEPREVISFWETPLGKIIFWVLLIIGLLIGLFWYIIYPLKIVYKWYKYGRDPKAPMGVASSWYDPPVTKNKRKLTPAETGTLIDETVDLQDITASIVDLARRGYLKIIEEKKNDFYLEKTKDWKAEELREFEHVLLKGIFKEKDKIRIKDTQLVDTVSAVKSSIYLSLLNEGFFPQNPDSIRKFYTVMWILAIVTFNLPLFIAGLVFGQAMPRKTDFGAQAANIAKSLKYFLSSQERQLQFQAKNQLMFERLLPFAVAFGVEKIWAERFKDIAIKPPTWYQSYSYGTFNSHSFVYSLDKSFSSVYSSATPKSSSSGFSSGFSGGGSSGGGGGGGGGGSW